MGVAPGPGVAASGRGPYWPADKANAVIQGTLAAIGPTAPFVFMGPMNLSIWGEFNTQLTATAGSLTGSVASAGAIAAGQTIKSTLVPPGATLSALAGTDITMVLPPRTLRGFVTPGSNRVTGLASTDWLAGAAVVSDYFAGGTTVSSIVTEADAAAGIQGVIELSADATSAPIIREPVPITFILDNDAIAAGVDAAAVFTGAAIGLVGTAQLERSFDGGSTWTVCNIGGSGALAQWSTASPISIAFGEPEKGVLYRLNTTALTPVAGTSLNYRISETGQAATTLSVPTL